MVLVAVETGVELVTLAADTVLDSESVLSVCDT